jgi:hypothetical protein
MFKLKRLVLAVLLVMAGGGLFGGLSVAQAGETEPSTSCAQALGFDTCVTNPTQACISDRPTCPFPPPVCYYNGTEPLGIKQLSCWKDAPPPDGTATVVCVTNPNDGTNIICVGSDNQSGDHQDYWCPWFNIVLDYQNTVKCDHPLP